MASPEPADYFSCVNESNGAWTFGCSEEQVSGRRRKGSMKD